MRITRLEVYGYALTYAHGAYGMSGGRVISTLPSTVVRVITDEGLEGWGEVCPLGSTYLLARLLDGLSRVVRRASRLPLVGDETVTDLRGVLDAARAGAVGINLFAVGEGGR